MKYIWQAEMADCRGKLLRAVIGFAGSMVIFLLLCRILKIDLNSCYKKISVLPDSLCDIVGFWKNKLILDSQKYWMTWMCVVNIPLLLYAAILPARLLGEEEENGTMAFICNGPFGRKEIFWGKLLTGVTCYGVVLAVMAVSTMVIALPGIRSKLVVAGFILKMCLMLFITGVFLMALTTVYCSIKRAYTCSADGVLVWFLVDTIIGYLYTVIMLVRDLITVSGRTVLLPKFLLKLLDYFKYVSVIQWCYPADVQSKFPWFIACFELVLAVVLILLSVKIYGKKEFGESK